MKEYVDKLSKEYGFIKYISRKMKMILNFGEFEFEIQPYIERMDDSR